jgi:aldehyde:ferredoxin oxidoreductase
MILNMEGVGRADDHIPYRLKNFPVASGPIKGRVVTDEMYNTMLSDFYTVRGWDQDGVVQDEIKKELGLDVLEQPAT